MEDHVEIAGSGRLRITTAQDVELSTAANTPAVPAPRVPNAMTASATRMRTKGDTAYYRRISSSWQYRALSYYDLIGEVRFASQFYAKLLSRVRFYPAILESDGSTTPITDGLPVELLNRIQDPGGGRSQIQYDYGRLMFITGEGALFGSNINTDEERWKFLWKDELRPTDDSGTWVRVAADGTETDERGPAYRFWTPHPRRSDEADSPLRPVWDICEELIVLTQSVMGTAVTRMTNGFITLPQELSFGAAEPIGDEDAENDPFLSDYAEHVQNQKENPASAEAKVPFGLIGPYEFLDRVTWIKTHDPATDYMEKDLRIEAIKRLGLSLDFNPEFLLGMTDANHWTALQVVHDQWRTHGVGVAKRFANDVNQSYLRPALRDENYGNWRNVVIAMDDSQVVLSPDRTADADLAYDRGQINDEAYLELKGLEASMGATEEDKRIMLAIKLRDPALLKGTPYEVEVPQPAVQPPGPVAAPNSNGNASEGPPPPEAGRTGSRQESMRASAEILGAAKMSLRRCREVAGARLRRAQQKCPECREATDGKPNSLVASILGPDQVMQLGINDPVKLVAGGADGLEEMLLEIGCDSLQASALKQMIEVYSGRTLFDLHPELPAGFVASVERALEVTRA